MRTDPNGKVTRTKYNPQGMPEEVVHDAGAGGRNLRTVQLWDHNRRLVEVRDPNGNPTRYRHDERDLLTAIVYADGTARTFEYSTLGYVKRAVDPNGTVVETDHDVRGMPARRRIRPGPGVGGATEETFWYDGVGQMKFASTVGGDAAWGGGLPFQAQVEFAHDLHGNVVGERQQVANAIAWPVESAFDEAQNRTSLTYGLGPVSRRIEFDPDPLNRVREIRDAAAGSVGRYDYVGQAVSRRASGNGTVLDVAYDALKRPVALVHRAAGGAGANLAGFEYAYGPAGEKEFEKRTGLQTRGAFAPGVEPAGGVADVFRYDGLYQLIGVKRGVPDAAAGRTYESYLSFGSEERYDFDGAGNRERVVRDEPGGPSSLETYNAIAGGGYVADVLNRITSLGGVARVHDANGNLIDDGERLFRYDWRNLLIEVARKSDGEVLGRYGYDALGRRVWRQVRRESAPGSGAFEAENRFYAYDGVRIVAEATDGGVAGSPPRLARTYANGIGIDEVLERTDYGPDGIGGLAVSRRLWFHENALGSVHLVTDAAGSPVERYEYDPWGKPRFFAWSGGAGGEWTETAASGIGNARLFTGREWDEESGLYGYRTRAYDPRTGRFLQRDPLRSIDPWNPYAYVGNAPWQWQDPLGLFRTGGFLYGAAITVAEPFAIVSDLFTAIGNAASGNDFTEGNYQSQTFGNLVDKLSACEGTFWSIFTTIGDVSLAVLTGGTVPTAFAIAEIWLAVDRGEITVSQADELLSEVAGGAAVVGLAGVAVKLAALRKVNSTKTVYTATDRPVDLARPPDPTGAPGTSRSMGGTFVTEENITKPGALEQHVRARVPNSPSRPAGCLPRFVTEIEVPEGSLRPDPHGGPPSAWIPPDAPGARVTRTLEVVEDPIWGTVLRFEPSETK